MSHRLLWTATLVLFFVVGVVAAQNKPQVRIAVGWVAKVGGTMLVVDIGGGKSLQFITSATTKVKVPAGGDRQEQSVEEARKGFKITDVVRVGDPVSVKYTDVSGKLMAQEIDLLRKVLPVPSPTAQPPSSQPQK